MSMAVLPLPGTEATIVSNSYTSIDLSWFGICAIVISITGIIIGIIIVTTFVVFFVQNELEAEPLFYSCLSLVFPIYKLPSVKMDKEASLKIHYWLVLIDNALLAAPYYVLYFLYKYDIYNPWCSLNMSTLLFPEEWFKCSFDWLTLLLVSATLPTLVVGSAKLNNCFTFWTWLKSTKSVLTTFFALSFSILSIILMVISLAQPLEYWPPKNSYLTSMQELPANYTLSNAEWGSWVTTDEGEKRFRRCLNGFITQPKWEWGEWFSNHDRSCGLQERCRRRCQTQNCSQPIEKCELYSKDPFQSCPGVLSDWSSFSICSKSCGKGEQIRWRECTGNGTCDGKLFETKECFDKFCPEQTNGMLSEWSSFSQCSVTCDLGTQVRTRKCLEPGTLCDIGPLFNSQSCFTKTCTTSPIGDQDDSSSCNDYCSYSSENTYCRFMNNSVPDASCKEVIAKGVDKANIRVILDQLRESMGLNFVWNEELALGAQLWANQCTFKIDENRHGCGGEPTQMIYMNEYLKGKSLYPEWKMVIKSLLESASYGTSTYKMEKILTQNFNRGKDEKNDIGCGMIFFGAARFYNQYASTKYYVCNLLAGTAIRGMK